MKMLKKLLTLTAAAALLLQSAALPAFADDTNSGTTAEPYTYTIRLSAGNQSAAIPADVAQTGSKCSISGAGTGELVISGLQYGDSLSLLVSGIETTGDSAKYKVVGIKYGGEDLTCSPNLTVTEDAGYVLAYGIMSGLVSYTVSYVYDGDGNPLPGSTTDTFYGEVGTVPAPAYRFFEGYTPIEDDSMAALQENASANVYVIRYKATTGPILPNGDTDDDDDDDDDNGNSSNSNSTQPTDPAVNPVTPPNRGARILPNGDQDPDANNDDDDDDDDDNGEPINGDNSGSSGEPAAPAPAQTGGTGGGASSDGSAEEAIESEDIGQNRTPLSGLFDSVKDGLVSIGVPEETAQMIAPWVVLIPILLLILWLLLFLYKKKKKQDQKDAQPVNEEQPKSDEQPKNE